MLVYPSLSGFENRELAASAAPKIWRVSSSARRLIWNVGRSGRVGSSAFASGSASEGGIVQLKLVKRALSRKTMPGKCYLDTAVIGKGSTLHSPRILNRES